MPLKRLVFSLFAVLAILFSCKKKHEPTPTPPPTPKPFVTDIYAVGYKIINGSTYGICWKNGSQIPITTELNSSIYGITVSGTDVYLVGNTSHGASYWKNGNLNYLHTGSVLNSAAYAIAVSGSDVYVGGWVQDAGDTHSRAVYWKNGIETSLTDGTTSSMVNSIAVNGSDVYCAGQNNQPDEGNSGGLNKAACWKNQTQIPLNGAVVASDGTFARGIALSGTDVYVTGYIISGVALWKNGSLQTIDDSSGSPLDSFGFAVGINGSDVYVLGEHGNEAAYWKNGTIKDMITGTYVASNVQGICFHDSDIYMSGNLSGTPVYWKNDTTYTLQNAGEQYMVSGVAVNRHQ